MNVALPTMSVRVDPTNPGQFFACCGLLELADRAWDGAEGWFVSDELFFRLRPSPPGDHAGDDAIEGIIDQVSRAGLAGELSPALKQEREELESKKRRLKQELTKQDLTKSEENRRKKLGELLREGAIAIGEPFNLRLDWWQEERDDTPKTWAGSQEVLRIARAALASSHQAFATDSPFDYCCVLRPVKDVEPADASATPKRRMRAKDGDEDKVEPFYFDSVRGANAHPADIGFSPNRIKGMTTVAFPAVEFLCLIGLQRFRPLPTATRRVFDYHTWAFPLAAQVAPLAVCGALPEVGSRGFRFENAFRTDQRKHKAFGAATPIGRSRS